MDKPHLQFEHKGYGMDKALDIKEGDKENMEERDINAVSAWAESDWAEAKANGYFDGKRPGAMIT
ncbi:hypothetical protein J2T12_000003 [Paenibacillus anaericanus]|nr:hypothetical protein [Paenibacillus anaericanus]